jgi:predicted metal-dependent peptidase
MHSKLLQVYRLASINGLYRIAERIKKVEVGVSPSGTAHTDGSKIVIDEKFLDTLQLKEILFVVAHEYYHIIYDHIRRGRDLNRRVYNIAGDVIINEHLVSMGFEKIPFGIYLDNKIFEGMPPQCDTSMKIYQWLMDNKVEQITDDMDMGDLTEDKEADADPQDALQNSVDRKFESMGKKASKELEDTLGVQKKDSDVQWMDLLTAMRIESGRLVERQIQHNYRRPSRRPEFPGVILPSSRHTTEVPKIDVYIDVSGSMGDNPVTIFAGLKSILAHMSVYKPTFYTFNTDIQKIDIRSDSFYCGGGTDIGKVISKIKTEKPDLSILITDCEDSVEKRDIPPNVIVVSNNKAMANYYTENWEKVCVV